MNKLTFFKKTVLALTGLLAVIMLASSGIAHAIPYIDDDTPPAPSPAFNVYTGVPAPWGDESDFLRARVPINGSDQDAQTQYVDPLNSDCADGQKIQMRVYVHNGASQYKNDNGNGPSVAHNTSVKVALPGTENTTFSPKATISAKDVATVNDTVTIDCNGTKVKLHYIAGSASQYSFGTNSVTPLSDSIVTTGVPIMSHDVPGDVWGCWQDRVIVVLAVQVEKIPVVTPSLGSCKAVDITADKNRTVHVNNVTADLTNATVVGHKIAWGDGTTSSKETDSHTYAKDGTYTIVVSVQVKFADGHTEWKTATACSRQVTFKPDVPPVVVPPTTPPTSLPSTGPGDMIGLFTAVTAAAALAHRFVWSRRYNV